MDGLDERPWLWSLGCLLIRASATVPWAAQKCRFAARPSVTYSYFWIGAAAFVTSLAVATTARAQPVPDEEHITSALPLEHDVFVTTKLAIYRGSWVLRKWESVAPGNEMPAGGMLAEEPRNAKDIYYFAGESMADLVSLPGRKSGIFRSSDEGKTWTLVCNDKGVIDVCVLPNHLVYCLTRRSDANAGDKPNSDRAAILRSRDHGKSWEDITHGASGMILRIFPDPDNPYLIALLVNNVRPGIIQSLSNDYKWERGVSTFVFSNRKNLTAAEFFARCYQPQDDAYVDSATLDNYFGRAFWSEVTIPAFDIAADCPSYVFPKSGSREVGIEVSFETYGNPTVTLLDDGSDVTTFWSAKVIDPTHAQYVTIKDQSRGSPTTGPAVNARWHTFDLSRGRPYRRLVDLSKLADFTAPGRYTVQLTYDDTGYKVPQAVWHGRFDGETFTVVVSGE